MYNLINKDKSNQKKVYNDFSSPEALEPKSVWRQSHHNLILQYILQKIQKQIYQYSEKFIFSYL